jgi:hypothetical protein
LYGNTSGATATAGASTTPGGGEELGGGMGAFSAPPPSGGGEDLGALPPEGGAGEVAPPPGGEVTPESLMARNMNLLVESNIIEGSKFIDLGQAQESLGEISKELDKLLNS